ncbi:YbaB/EbfC family nucleoid-associated protein [Actinoplanes sp. NPDC049316]|uniref:YbaB/EbfC family nucleoid-associated protein n=1 Tax=Actinoplanes sp. NPDC049316 TaxID=3154727 RepID=UPI00343A5CA6
MSEASDMQAFLDPDASRQYLRSWKDNVDRMAARAAAMTEQMEQLRVTARDGNGLAAVTIDSAGVLVGLELTDRIHRLEPAVVARAVMSALREARAQAARRAHGIAVEVMGPDSLSAHTTADRMRSALDRPEESQEASQEQAHEREF